MKRKFKLFGSVAALLLAVSLMSLGVFAATTADSTINGTITYTLVGNVEAEVEIRVTPAGGATTVAQSKLDADAQTEEDFVHYETISYKTDVKEDGFDVTDSDFDPLAITLTESLRDLNEGNKEHQADFYTISITVRNLNTIWKLYTYATLDAPNEETDSWLEWNVITTFDNIGEDDTSNTLLPTSEADGDAAEFTMYFTFSVDNIEKIIGDDDAYNGDLIPYKINLYLRSEQPPDRPEEP